MSNKPVSTQKKRLLEILVNKSFRYNKKEKIYKLASGKLSNYYVDAKATTLDPEGMSLIGNILFAMISHIDIDAVGGLTLGADPISFAVSTASRRMGRMIRPFIVRKNAKSHGTKKWIEGNVKENDRVIIIDDVITTGKSTLEAADKARRENLSIIKAVALVDREEGGKENIEKEGIPVEAVFTKTDMIDMYKLKN